jgi:hypothetical protein
MFSLGAQGGGLLRGQPLPAPTGQHLARRANGREHAFASESMAPGVVDRKAPAGEPPVAPGDLCGRRCCSPSRGLGDHDRGDIVMVWRGWGKP